MADDVEIVLGAKNKASAILQQVSSETRNLSKSVQSMAAQTAASTQRMEVSFSSLKKAAGPLLAAFAAVKSITAGFSFASGSIEAFNVQADAVRGLTKAIELNGGASGPTIEKHKAWASEMQSLVNVGDEVTLGLMRQASMMGVSNDQLQDVTKAAIGLSEATGVALPEALKKVTAATNGNAASLQELIPGIRHAKTEEERLAMVMDVAKNGLLQAQDATTSLSGVMQRSANSFGDLQEVFGQIMEPLRMLISQGFAVLYETLQTMLAPAAERAQAAVANIGSKMETVTAIAKSVGQVIGVAFQAVQNVFSALGATITSVFDNAMGSGLSFADVVHMVAVQVIKGITFMEVIFTNMNDVIELVASYFRLKSIQMAEDAKHTFTVVIPAYTTWFAENWLNLLRDAAVGALTIYTNLAKKLENLLVIAFEAAIKVGQWFVDNFVALMRDLGSAVITIITNYGMKWIRGFQAIFDFIASGFDGGVGKLIDSLNTALSGSLLEGFEATAEAMPDVFQGVGVRINSAIAGDLMEGFEATTQSLPEIAERAITEREQQLQSRMGEIGGNLGAEFAAKFAERTEALGDGIKADLKTDLDIKANATVTTKQKADNTLQAAESRLQTRGRADSKIDQVAKNTEKANALLSGVEKATNRVAEVLTRTPPAGTRIQVVS